MPVSKHAIDKAKEFYHQPYPPPHDETMGGIARPMHGMQHVSRVTAFSQIWSNLYQLTGVELSPEDIEHIQLAALFHDSARQGEETDYWDNDSALNLYNTLIEEHGLSPERAALIAESMANKDAEPGDKFMALNRTTQPPTWEKSTYSQEKQSSHSKFIDCIHDADCLDILRARDHFDASYLTFFKKHVAKQDGLDNDNLELLSSIVTQARGLIAKQGDKRGHLNLDTKKRYEYADNPYEETSKDIRTDPRFFALATLFDSQRLRGKSLKEVQQEINNQYREQRHSLPKELQQSLEDRTLFIRGITDTGIRRKQQKQGRDETNAELELRKIFRRRDTATLSGRMDKEGNPNRSISYMTPGMDLFANVSLLVQPNYARIAKVSVVDCDSGCGKKAGILEHSSHEKVIEELASLRQQVIIGTNLRDFSDGTASAHNEVLARVIGEDIKGVCFSLNHSSFESRKSPEVIQLQAIYMQQMLEKKYQTRVPLLEYQPDYDVVTPRHYTEEDILALWQEHIIQNIAQSHAGDVSLTDIREDLIHAEVYYSEQLQQKIAQFFTQKYEEQFQEKAKAAPLLITTWINSIISDYQLEIKDEAFKQRLSEELKSALTQEKKPDTSFIIQLIQIMKVQNVASPELKELLFRAIDKLGARRIWIIDELQTLDPDYTKQLITRLVDEKIKDPQVSSSYVELSAAVAKYSVLNNEQQERFIEAIKRKASVQECFKCATHLGLERDARSLLGSLTTLNDFKEYFDALSKEELINNQGQLFKFIHSALANEPTAYESWRTRPLDVYVPNDLIFANKVLEKLSKAGVIIPPEIHSEIAKIIEQHFKSSKLSTQNLTGSFSQRTFVAISHEIAFIAKYGNYSALMPMERLGKLLEFAAHPDITAKVTQGIPAFTKAARDIDQYLNIHKTELVEQLLTQNKVHQLFLLLANHNSILTTPLLQAMATNKALFKYLKENNKDECIEILAQAQGKSRADYIKEQIQYQIDELKDQWTKGRVSSGQYTDAIIRILSTQQDYLSPTTKEALYADKEVFCAYAQKQDFELLTQVSLASTNNETLLNSLSKDQQADLLRHGLAHCLQNDRAKFIDMFSPQIHQYLFNKDPTTYIKLVTQQQQLPEIITVVLNESKKHAEKAQAINRYMFKVVYHDYVAKHRPLTEDNVTTLEEDIAVIKKHRTMLGALGGAFGMRTASEEQCVHFRNQFAAMKKAGIPAAESNSSTLDDAEEVSKKQRMSN